MMKIDLTLPLHRQDTCFGVLSKQCRISSSGSGSTLSITEISLENTVKMKVSTETLEVGMDSFE